MSGQCLSRSFSCKYSAAAEEDGVTQPQERSFMSIVHLLPETPCDPFKTQPVEMKHRSAEVFHRREGPPVMQPLLNTSRIRRWP